ncbi:MAG: hypothetical protein KAU14_01380 [Thermoplasmata archaeon]|nr:hypothetical protein [Thermoplasmata archaeon]
MKIGESHERVLIFTLIFVALAVCVCFLTQNAGARTITVDDAGGGNFTKIQDAINASENGDTIRVWEGTYFEDLVVNKTVSLIGNGSEVSVIDGKGNDW